MLKFKRAHLAFSTTAILGIIFLIPNVTEARGGGGGHSGGGHSGSVHVNGYYRGNGTYVSPYNRSAPGGGGASDYLLPGYTTPSYSSPDGTDSSYSWPTYSQQSLINSLPKSGAISGGENSISIIDVNINGKPFGKSGIMVNGQAYISTNLLKEIPMRSKAQVKDITLTLYSAQTLGISMLNYNGQIFIEASRLNDLYSSLSISWDNKIRTVVLQTPVS